MAQTPEQMLRQLSKTVNMLLTKTIEQANEIADIKNALVGQAQKDRRVTIREASQLMQCSVRKVYKMIDNATITTASKENGCIRVSLSEITKYIPATL